MQSGWQVCCCSYDKPIGAFQQCTHDVLNGSERVQYGCVIPRRAARRVSEYEQAFGCMTVVLWTGQPYTVEDLKRPLERSSTYLGGAF